MKIAAYHLGIELTQNCNLDCIHCYKGEKKCVNISREILERVFDEIKYVYILNLSGGEIFLGYEQLKMLLEIAREKKTQINNCSMIINGTLYDQRIYDLLDEYFGDNYQIGISDDDFHDKSIQRICGKNKDSLERVKKNMSLHLENPHSIGFIRVSKRLIDNGRASSLDTPKKKFEALGYYYSTYGKGCFAGPMIFIGADGYISDINSDIDKRNEQSIGNIKNTTIFESLLNGGIKIECNLKNPFEEFEKREIDFALHKGAHLIFKENKITHTTYNPDTKYLKAMDNLKSDMLNFFKAKKEGKVEDFLDNWDPIYDGDLSQIEHEKRLILN